MQSSEHSDVIEWDEYGQGYDYRGRRIVCVCGIELLQPGSLNPDGTPHYCPYDEEGELVHDQ